MTEQPSTPASILTVTWDTVIGSRQVGYDEDSGPEIEPVSLGEMVVAELADRLIGDMRRDVDEHRYYRNAVDTAREVATDAAREQAANMVAEVLRGEIRPTNRYGEPEGEPTTLRELIRDDIQRYLADKSKRTDRNGRQDGFSELLRREVDQALADELRDEIRAARAEVAAKVRERAADILGDVVKRETR